MRSWKISKQILKISVERKPTWSGLNLEDRDMPSDDQTHQLRDLITLFCIDKIHLVSKYSNKKETQTTADIWKDYKVRMIY